MKVLVGPRAGADDQVVSGAARALAGPGGSVVFLRDAGVRNLSRPLSQAEVALLRQVLRERPEAGGGEDGDGAEVLIGYVCKGVLAGRLAASAEVVGVTDHANLTWRSPLTGPNDDSAGPRFPSMTAVYVSEPVVSRVSAAKGMIVRPGTVAGVSDDSHLNAFEAEMTEAQGFSAVSSELVPVVIVAAHMGLRVPAAVVVTGCSTEGVG